MNGIKLSVQTQVHDATNLAPSRASRSRVTMSEADEINIRSSASVAFSSISTTPEGSLVPHPRPAGLTDRGRFLPTAHLQTFSHSHWPYDPWPQLASLKCSQT